MAIDRDIPDFDGSDGSSPTDHVLIEPSLRPPPLRDEPTEAAPEAHAVGGAVADIFDTLVSTLSGTRLEPDLDNLLWSTVSVFIALPIACTAARRQRGRPEAQPERTGQL